MSARAARFAEECSWSRVWDDLIADYRELLASTSAFGSAG